MKRTGIVVGAIALLGAGAAMGFRTLRPAGVPVRDVPVFEVDEVPFTRTVHAEGVLKPVRTTLISAPSETREALLIGWMADDGDPVKKGDVVIRFDSGELTRRLADGEAERAAADSRIEREQTMAASSLSDRDRAARLTKEEIERTKQLGKKDPRFFPRAEVIESEIDDGLYQARLQHAQRARTIEEKLARSKLDLLGIERRKAELANKQARAVIKELEIRAPHDGTFVLQRWGIRGVLRAGDRAFPGMRIAEISTSDRMDAELYVLEADAGGLTAGKTATVILEARPDVVWKAKVKKVDPFPKPRQPEVPAQYFTTVLELEGDTSGLKPGQRLHGTVVLDEQPRAMVVPRQAVFRRDNDTIVYRRDGARFEPVKVKLGAGTVGRLVITEGVRPGDEIALRDPTQSSDDVGGSRGGRGGAPSLPGAAGKRARP